MSTGSASSAPGGVRALVRRFLPASWREGAADFALWVGDYRRQTWPPEADPIEESLGQQLLALDGGLGLFRLVHLLDALQTAGNPRILLEAGSGGGSHAAYLAYQRPRRFVHAVDLRSPSVGLSPPNLRFYQGDLLDVRFRASLPQADFVFSIECLEHIEDDRSVFAGIAALVRPGGFLYVQVPFASDEEQADPVLCRTELENHEHVRPGYAAHQLEALAGTNGLRVQSVEGAFWFPTQPLVWIAHDRLGGPDVLAPHWRTFLDIARLDFRRAVPKSRNEATAIKLLAYRPK